MGSIGKGIDNSGVLYLGFVLVVAPPPKRVTFWGESVRIYVGALSCEKLRD